jgi:hypothetical protein
LVGETGRDRPLQAGQGDELRHRGSDVVAVVRLVDVHDGGQRLLAVAAPCAAGGSRATTVGTCS